MVCGCEVFFIVCVCISFFGDKFELNEFDEADGDFGDGDFGDGDFGDGDFGDGEDDELFPKW